MIYNRINPTNMQPDTYQTSFPLEVFYKCLKIKFSIVFTLSNLLRRPFKVT